MGFLKYTPLGWSHAALKWIGSKMPELQEALPNLSDSVSSLIAGVTGAELTGAEREANRFSAAQAQLARDWEERMYNQYESPKALVEQYKEAGLNPALMYGSSVGGNVGTAAGVPSSTAPSDSNLLGLVELAMQGSLFASQKRKAVLENEGLELGNEEQRIRNKYLDSLLGAQISLSWAQAEQAIRAAEESDKRKGLITAQIAQSVAAAGLADAQRSQSIAQAALIAAETTLKETQNNNEVKQGKLLDNEIFISTFDKNFVDAYGSRIDADSRSTLLRVVLRVLGEDSSELPARTKGFITKGE